jgi:signal transduction histidine kinase
MRLPVFIRANTELIVDQWENFARTLVQVENISSLALRDHIKNILVFIADDIESLQTRSEQIEKSHGEKYRLSKHSTAEIHAALRLSGGFNMDQMVAEYRALRTSIIRLWEEQLNEVITDLDITDLIRFNESIDQQLTEAISHYTKKLDHSKNIFLGILSHDLRNPLGAARMCAEYVLKSGTSNLNERQTMLIAQVIESTDRATEILTYLLDLTRARLGSGIPMDKEPMDIGMVGRAIVEELRAMHPSHTITLEISGNLEGEWDKPRIGQVFSNLISNAIQYSFPDSPIDVTVRGNEKEVTVSVHNEGMPIPRDAIGRIFDSLTRGGIEEDSANPPGLINLGLGLYITKEIVVAHGGTIDVLSSEPEGTTFIAAFPRLT